MYDDDVEWMLDVVVVLFVGGCGGVVDGSGGCGVWSE